MHVDDPHPAPGPAERWVGELSINLIDVHLEGPAWHRNGRMALGAPGRGPAGALIPSIPGRPVGDRRQELVIEGDDRAGAGVVGHVAGVENEYPVAQVGEVGGLPV